MTYREIWKAVVLSIVTFGIYAVVWQVKVKGELNSQGAEIPSAWWLIVPVGNIWWLYKYGEGIEKVTNGKYSAGLAFVLLFLTSIVGQAVLQTEFNKMAGVPTKTGVAAKDKVGNSNKNWFAAHKLLSAAVVVVLLGTAIAVSSGGSTKTIDKSKSVAVPPQKEEVIAQPPEAKPEKGVAGGMYKVGTDLPAGEYVIVGSGYLQISSDSSGTLDSVIENDNYSNRTIVLVADGQYIQFQGRAYVPAEAPKVDTSSGVLESGRYKVGTDFPAGEYKVTPIGSGYMAVSSTASGSISAIISNDNFETEKYITLKDGQYFKLSSATLKL